MQTTGTPGTVIADNVPIIFNSVLINEGGFYNNNNGIFTAPYYGKYTAGLS